jgi:hypothetical protein
VDPTILEVVYQNSNTLKHDHLQLSKPNITPSRLPPSKKPFKTTKLNFRDDDLLLPDTQPLTTRNFIALSQNDADVQALMKFTMIDKINEDWNENNVKLGDCLNSFDDAVLDKYVDGIDNDVDNFAAGLDANYKVRLNRKESITDDIYEKEVENLKVKQQTEMRLKRKENIRDDTIYEKDVQNRKAKQPSEMRFNRKDKDFPKAKHLDIIVDIPASFIEIETNENEWNINSTEIKLTQTNIGSEISYSDLIACKGTTTVTKDDFNVIQKSVQLDNDCSLIACKGNTTVTKDDFNVIQKSVQIDNDCSLIAFKETTTATKDDLNVIQKSVQIDDCCSLIAYKGTAIVTKYDLNVIQKSVQIDDDCSLIACKGTTTVTKHDLNVIQKSVQIDNDCSEFISIVDQHDNDMSLIEMHLTSNNASCVAFGKSVDIDESKLYLPDNIEKSVLKISDNVNEMIGNPINVISVIEKIDLRIDENDNTMIVISEKSHETKFKSASKKVIDPSVIEEQKNTMIVISEKSDETKFKSVSRKDIDPSVMEEPTETGFKTVSRNDIDPSIMVDDTNHIVIEENNESILENNTKLKEPPRKELEDDSQLSELEDSIFKEYQTVSASKDKRKSLNKRKNNSASKSIKRHKANLSIPSSAELNNVPLLKPPTFRTSRLKPLVFKTGDSSTEPDNSNDEDYGNSKSRKSSQNSNKPKRTAGSPLNPKRNVDSPLSHRKHVDSLPGSTYSSPTIYRLQKTPSNVAHGFHSGARGNNVF